MSLLDLLLLNDPTLVVGLLADDIVGNDGDTIAIWPDSTPNHHDVVQVDPTKYPVLKKNVLNGRAAVRFLTAGVFHTGEYLASSSFALPQPSTILVVGKFSVDQVAFLVNGLTVGSQQALFRDAPDRLVAYAAVKVFHTYGVGNYDIIGGVFDGVSSQLLLNGTVLATGNAGAMASDGLTVGAAYDGSSSLTGDIACVLVFSHALSVSELAYYTDWLAAYYDIAVPQSVTTTRDNVETLLSLHRYASIMGINPWYFSQATNETYIGQTECDPLWLQHAWMDADKLSREDLSQAIAQAEADIARELGFWPAPKWFSNEDHRYPPHYNKALFGVYGIDQRGQGKSISTKWGKVRAVGQRANTVVLAGANTAIVGDNVTIMSATTVTDPAEIAVYFQQSDGADAAASDNYRIRPLNISISGGVVTITGKKWLFLRPVLWESATPIDADDVTNYVFKVDVYRVYSDPSAPADFFWETTPEGCTDTDQSGCSFITQPACLLIRNAENGYLVPSPAEWDAATAAFTEQSFSQNWEPDKVRINYRAGYPLGADGEMNDTWARAVAYYATALLGREGCCACGNATKFMKRWQEDLAINIPDTNYQVNADILGNPFGTERGAVFAWQRVKREAQGGGIAI